MEDCLSDSSEKELLDCTYSSSFHDVRLLHVPFHFEAHFPSARGHCLRRWRRMYGDCHLLVLCMVLSE